MPVCGLCRNVVEKECPDCKYPDALIERKYNKHRGKAPIKDRLGQRIGDPNADYKWPTFKKGQSMPRPPDADPSR